MIELPKPCAKPCNDCPWRVNALPGWLGPMGADQWVALIHSEEPIACHQTIEVEVDQIEGDWNHPAMRQCAGAAIMRTNVCKSPRNPTDAAHAFKADREAVFASVAAFKDYHGKLSVAVTADTLEDPCDVCGEQEAEWWCPHSHDMVCNDCVDDHDGKCPTCDQDPGWLPLDNDDEDR